MSADEDTELRDLVAQTLETNGVLANIRAQLRANVFLALEEQEHHQNKKSYVNQRLVKFLTTTQGRQVAGLVHDFLQFFDLDYTMSVFQPESGFKCDSRADLARDLHLDDSQQPLLLELLLSAKNSKTKRQTSGAEELGAKHLQDAKRKFEKYDKDKSGTIEKDELRDLFSDTFPSLHRSMLDRYVNEEFKATDRDFSSTIDFSEFADMYRRLFVVCKTTVSEDVADILSPRPTPSKIPAPLFHKVHTGSKASEVQPIERVTSRATPSPRDLTSEPDTDSFFDEPPLILDDSKNDDTDGWRPPVSNTQSSLSGLPTLGERKKASGGDFKDVDRRLADLGLEVPEDDYDDDFESSHVSGLGARSERTPRDIEESIHIDEDLYVTEDILRSDPSVMDDLTTDRTISPTDHSSVFDYMEDVIHT